ncbi:hypothetical protein SDC9_181193 [bioreactor metagenome]|uniref:Uncharacterized protein n=1 Tax=bioreactor metagenome TaxID=1076179 RepID=A0A645H5T1_9ZZZZ
MDHGCLAHGHKNIGFSQQKNRSAVADNAVYQQILNLFFCGLYKLFTGSQIKANHQKNNQKPADQYGIAGY